MKSENIKFRGILLNIKHPRWVYGDIEHGSVNTLVDGHLVHYGTICQFTGLKDCYGTDIYEGDILQICEKSQKDAVKFEVFWNESSARFMLRCLSDKTDVSSMVSGNEFEKATGKKLKVCGSIYDNEFFGTDNNY